MLGLTILDFQLTPSDGGRNDKSSGFDPVGNNRVFSTAQSFDSLNFNGGKAGAANAAAHLV